MRFTATPVTKVKVMSVHPPARKGRDITYYEHDAAKPRRKPGRPCLAGKRPTKLTLPFAYVDRAATIITALLTSPRSKRAQADAARLAADLRRRLEPAPSSPQDAGLRGARGPIGYDVGLPDGSVVRYATLAEAAQAYKVKPASLAAMLAKGGRGKCQRKWGDATVWCRRVYAHEDVPTTNQI